MWSGQLEVQLLEADARAAEDERRLATKSTKLEDRAAIICTRVNAWYNQLWHAEWSREPEYPWQTGTEPFPSSPDPFSDGLRAAGLEPTRLAFVLGDGVSCPADICQAVIVRDGSGKPAHLIERTRVFHDSESWVCRPWQRGDTLAGLQVLPLRKWVKRYGRWALREGAHYLRDANPGRPPAPAPPAELVVSFHADMLVLYHADGRIERLNGPYADREAAADALADHLAASNAA